MRPALRRIAFAAGVIMLSACAHVPPARDHDRVLWVTRQISAGYFPLPGLCQSYIRSTNGAQREALSLCALGEFEGAVYWANRALLEEEEWMPPR